MIAVSMNTFKNKWDYILYFNNIKNTTLNLYFESSYFDRCYPL